MAQETTATIEGSGADRVLVIRVPMNERPVESASKKTMVIASTHGNKELELEYEGKPVTVGVNAYFKKPK